jgi:VanZ family protein
MIFIFIMSSQEQFPSTFGVSIFLLTVVAHLILYGVLGLLLLFAVTGTDRPSRTSIIVTILFTVLYGVSDEFHQSFVPGRDASVFDVVVDTVGAAVAVIGGSYARSALHAATFR